MWIRQHLSSRSCKMVKTVKEGFLQETHWPSVPGDQVRGAVIPICCFCRLVPFPILALGKWWALWGNNTPFCDYFQRLIEDTSVFNFQNLIASLRFKIYIDIYIYIYKCIYFGCAGSSLLHGLSSSCIKQELLSSCRAQSSHCSGFSCGKAQALGIQIQ